MPRDDQGVLGQGLNTHIVVYKSGLSSSPQPRLLDLGDLSQSLRFQNILGFVGLVYIVLLIPYPSGAQKVKRSCMIGLV